MVSTLFRYPQALSSTLASLGMLQPRAFGSLNCVETLDSTSNYYMANSRNRLYGKNGHRYVLQNRRQTDYRRKVHATQKIKQDLGGELIMFLQLA